MFGKRRFGMSGRGRTGRTRRATGWILSALWMLAFYSPQAEALRRLPERFVIASGQQATVELPFPLQMTLHAREVQALSGTDESLEDKTGTTAAATVSLLGLIPLKDVTVEIREDLRVYPGGQAVGVALQTEGVLVVGVSDLTGGVSPARLAGIKAGDVILQANGKALASAEELTELVRAGGERPLPLLIRRGESQLRLTLEPRKDGSSGSYRIGAWVRDSTAGVGTLSFYGQLEEGGATRYGALGHAITDTDTQQILHVSHGELMAADVVDVRRGVAGTPGELKGSFLREHNVLGDIRLNNSYGLYGELSQTPVHPLYPDGLPIGRRDAVHTGPASILCTVEGNEMQEYAVEIVEVARQSAPAQRSMILRVTDERLLARTGGVVQGMSGSPILQDGRLIGAVTHVFVNDPTMGYGLFVEWMLQQRE